MARPLGAATVQELTPAAQERFRDVLSARLRRRVLETHARWRRGELAAVPPLITTPDSVPRQRVLEAAELQDFRAAIEDEHLAMFVMLALNTGARPAALLALTRFQVDFGHGLIDLNPPGRRQTAKRRPVVRITTTLRPWLEMATGSHLVAYRGRPLSSVKAAWRRTRQRVGLGADVIPYTLRHTVATRLDELGVAEGDIMTFMGWASAGRMKDWYTKRRVNRPERLAGVASALDGWMAELALRRETVAVAIPAALPDQPSAWKERASV